MNRKTTESEPSLDAVLEFIEAKIIFGEMKPGVELTEDWLMETTGAKRHIVRGALEQMIRQGLVTKQRGHSARVKMFNPVEVNEVYEMRTLLHREAVRIMPLPAAKTDILALSKIHRLYEEAIDAGAPPIQIHRLNDGFHRTIWALSRNNLLQEMIETLNVRSASIRSHGITDQNWLKQARLEHRAIIAAIEDGDREKLARLVVDHMHPTRQIWENMHMEYTKADENGSTI